MIHFIWLGSPISADDQRRINDWGKIDTINLVTEIPVHLQSLCDLAPTWQAKSDLIRYWLILEHGGIYLDTDCEVGNTPVPKLDVFAGGCKKTTGEQCWSNFLIGAAKPGHKFWADTLEKCRKQDYVEPREPMSLFFYNIECLWGINPVIPVVNCWQQDPWFETPTEYAVKHLARTKIDDYLVVHRNVKVLGKKRNSQVETARRVSICTKCPDYNRTNELCRKCGCVARARIPDHNISCPEGKW